MFRKDKWAFIGFGAVIGFFFGGWHAVTDYRLNVQLSDEEIIRGADTTALCNALAGRELEPFEWLIDWTTRAESYRACITRYDPQWAAEMAPPLPPYVRYPATIDVDTLGAWIRSAEETVLEVCAEPTDRFEVCADRDLEYVDAYADWALSRLEEAAQRGQ